MNDLEGLFVRIDEIERRISGIEIGKNLRILGEAALNTLDKRLVQKNNKSDDVRGTFLCTSAGRLLMPVLEEATKELLKLGIDISVTKSENGAWFRGFKFGKDTQQDVLDTIKIELLAKGLIIKEKKEDNIWILRKLTPFRARNRKASKL